MFSVKKLVSIICFLPLVSCFSSKEFSQESSGKLSVYKSLDQKSFSFVVGDRSDDDKDLEVDDKYLGMFKSDVATLKRLLKKNNYCITKKGKLLFEITSKQTKIYDVTLSNLIDQQYNARSLTPVTYFGKCL